jgi:hypothetical protein
MSKCFILGAGFSNAVAELSVTKDLITRFKKIQEDERIANPDLRVQWGETIKEFLSKLESQFIPPSHQSIVQGSKNDWSIWYSDIESLLTFIDANLISPLHTEVVVNNEPVYSIKESPFWRGTDLREVRGCIQTYLYLSLSSNFHVNENLKRFIDILSPGDNVISFNYDLVLDKGLFESGIWKPGDGYGFPAVNDKYEAQSTISLLKLHGSLNWEKGLEGKIELNWFDDKRQPYFDGYVDMQPPPFDYEGKHLGNWVLPSYIKPLNSELFIDLWKKAHQELMKAEEVVVIGYSLPDADSTVRLLFTLSNIKNKSLTIVDKNDQEVKEKFETLTGNLNAKSFNSLENYLSDSHSVQSKRAT